MTAATATTAPRRLAGAGALLAAFALGVLLGRREAPPASVPARGTARAGATPGGGSPPGRRVEPGCGHGPAHADAPATGEAPAAGPVGPALDLEDVLARGRARAAAPDDERLCDDALASMDALERAVASDPQAMAEALARLRRTTDPAELELLAAVLARIQDQEVEETALELTRAGDPAAQAAGFDMLDALDLPSGRTAALDGLARARDPQVRRAALRALPPPVGASLDEAAGVVASLSGLVTADADPELRRRAAVELGRWHRVPDDLSPLLLALERDPDPNVRAGAAFGLELAARRDPSLVAALVAAVRRPDEDPLVRENAWKALGALGPLPAEVQADYRRYEDELAAREE